MRNTLDARRIQEPTCSNKSEGKPLLIAVCGIDGVGKTTLIDKLKKETFSKDFVFVQKRTNEIFKLAKKYHPFAPADGKPWIGNSFSRAIAYACAFDFLQHFSKNVQPQLEAGKVIVSDRYSLSWLVYAHIVGNVYSDIRDLLGSIPEPDHLIYIYASNRVVKKRLEARGDKSATSEHRRKAYEEILTSYRNVTRISSERRIQEVYREFRMNVLAIINSHAFKSI